jgi:tetratricopeptide (TPR) repeat protein
MSIFQFTRQTRNLILVMIVIVVLGVVAAWIYYRHENAAVDPRIMDARLMLKEYDELMKEGAFEDGMVLLDSIEHLYQKVPCYANSFEMGVVFNNRASAWLTMALYKTHDSLQKVEMLELARREIIRSIRFYEAWIAQYESYTDKQIQAEVIRCFPSSDPIFQGKDYLRILNKRIDDIKLARIETPRRLSVSYSNLGIIQRHQYQQDSAIQSYIKALKLWKRNPTAKNNLNTLMGREPEDESIIQQLFPPDRRKPD